MTSHKIGFGTQGSKKRESMAYQKPYEGILKGELRHQQLLIKTKKNIRETH